MYDTTEVDQAIAAVIGAARTYAGAKRRESDLEDARPLAKSEAITRIMQLNDPQKQKPYSATAAESLVITDPAYAAHREEQADAAVETIMAKAQYEAARFRAALLTGLASVSA